MVADEDKSSDLADVPSQGDVSKAAEVPSLNLEQESSDDVGSDYSPSGDCVVNGNATVFEAEDLEKAATESKVDNGVETFASNPLTVTVETSPPVSEKVIDFSDTIQWTEALKSPLVPAFSPSVNPNSPGNLHGLGLKLALQRSKSTGIFCKQVISFLNSMATIYEQYGVNLIKISQSVRPGRLPFDEKALVLQDDFASLYENIKTFGNAFRSLAQYFRTSIVASVRTTLMETSKTVEAANDRYQRVRQDGFQSRQSAKALYNKYQTAIQAADREIQTWLQELDGSTNEAGESENGSEIVVPDDGTWEKVVCRFGSSNSEGTHRLIRILKDLQACEAEYTNSVAIENQKVALSQEMETVALQKLQETEQDRLLLFAMSVVDKVFQGEIEMEGLKLVTPSNTESSFAEGFEKKGKDLLAGLNVGLFKQQQSLPYEPGMGVMEAETMDLPTEVGELRDKVKVAFANHEVRIKATETLFKLLEDIGQLTNESSLEVRNQSQAQIGNQSQSSTNANVMGKTSGRLWLATVNTFQYEAKLFSDVALTCNKLKNAKIEKWLVNASRSLRNEMELDDSAWKLVCDSARTELRSESRYKYSKGQADKARSRASSRGDLSSGSNDSSDRPTTPKPDNPSLAAPPSPVRWFKGGGQVMKKALGHISEDQKEENDKFAFEEASLAKQNATIAYKAYTSSRIEKLETRDNEGWEELKDIIENLLQTARRLKEARKELLGFEIAAEVETSFPSIPSDLDEWCKTVKERITQRETATSTETHNLNYLLAQSKIKADNVYKILAMGGDEETLPALKRVEEVVDSAMDGSPQQSENTRPSSSMNGEKSTSLKTMKSSMMVASSSTIDESKHGAEEIQEDTRRDQSIQTFKKQFWSSQPEDGEPPVILEIFKCSYRPKDKSAFLTPNLHGRCFTTDANLYFLAWDNKKFTLKWEDILSVEFDKGFMGSSSENALAVTYRTGNSESAFTLSRLVSGERILPHLQGLLKSKEKSKRSIAINPNDGTEDHRPPVSQDALLKEMEVVVSKPIKNVSIQAIYQSVWEDSPGKKSFYEAWLEDEECFDITMGVWEHAEQNSYFSNPWCCKKGETYSQRRLVTFKFKRTTHLYIGPPVAFVKQEHYIRVEGDDKIVLAIEATFEGIPYSDTFGVEMRWIATRQGSKDVKIEVGLFVLFKKSTLLKSQIKAGTIIETKNVHTRLFNAVKKACVEPGDATRGEEDEENDVGEKEGETENVDTSLLTMAREVGLMSPLRAAGLVVALFVGQYAFSYVFGSSGQGNIDRLESQMSELQEEVRALQKSVDTIVELLKSSRR